MLLRRRAPEPPLSVLPCSEGLAASGPSPDPWATVAIPPPAHPAEPPGDPYATLMPVASAGPADQHAATSPAGSSAALTPIPASSIRRLPRRSHRRSCRNRQTSEWGVCKGSAIRPTFAMGRIRSVRCTTRASITCTATSRAI